MLRRKEKDNNNGYGKIEDKGKLSPQHMFQPGVASSTGFIGMLPPVSLHRGGAV